MARQTRWTLSTSFARQNNKKQQVELEDRKHKKGRKKNICVTDVKNNIFVLLQ